MPTSHHNSYLLTDDASLISSNELSGHMYLLPLKMYIQYTPVVLALTVFHRYPLGLSVNERDLLSCHAACVY